MTPYAHCRVSRPLRASLQALFRRQSNLIIHSLLFLLLVSQSSAEADTYYYTGASQTTSVAYLSRARMRMDAHPRCRRHACHAVAWTVLWDVHVTNQYVEAGIGYSPSFKCRKKKSVGLWWASPQAPYGTVVACVPRGTEVMIAIERADGHEGALVTWEWAGGQVSHWVETPGWTDGPGIHPAKVEVYSAKDSVAPGPLAVSVSDVLLYPEDTQVFLEQTSPYLATPDSTPSAFSVQY